MKTLKQIYNDFLSHGFLNVLLKDLEAFTNRADFKSGLIARDESGELEICGQDVYFRGEDHAN